MDITTTTGTVIDGYLNKCAKVCIDKNENGKCNTDKPIVYTDKNATLI